ncbi:MAG: DNA repair protein RecO [Candidatus Staskawiczbacteria bacterium RIFCSPHIGHO2_02_FULL_43_16]|uniref:DNA repair protein RecO n=1 Tax=Candidatus Staskawiczbacteria bacterium RIFCSPHIGHO2_01_FULL_41_41 TaxID=1802203 RepID=A0A1G2HS37_9BACT|nr:MAG: DNA repair protein RecO [Candidatus Staskawiczbacteria bacterium RIFCSPHIGHO2_01_FULL_41_41]OGZ68086.1 MAG: DNA repair protein RecO [Candidatus Staskawiczbacteria bacterium RIFCSPHIGHO2_02_FULL_43_16]OGZ74824.1 MAG: DNA repair protein RecO [Candidatus Staskawiczbacteria bacterium RIFCSPLOWO2_01_FULL_43_17b]
MAVKYATEAFVFKKEDRMDADRIFSVFTRDFGRLEIFGKAIRHINSKLRGGLELFSFSEIEFIQGKNKKILTDALLQKRYGALAKEPEKFAVANAIARVLGDFIKGQEVDPGIWDFIADIFEKLQDPATNSKLLYYYFFWNFISLLGYRPELANCVACRQALNPASLYFSYAGGGIACNMCAAHDKTATKVNADTVKILRLMVKQEWGMLLKLKVSPPSKKMLKAISDSYYHYLNDNAHYAN